jgi:hypothetical protein
MLKRYSAIILLIVVFFNSSIVNIGFAQAQEKATIFLSPKSETVLVDSTFEISVFLDTHGASINAVELNLKFSADTLRIVEKSGGTSLISLWLEPATYSNAQGTARFTGVIPNGITTQSGLITTLTFKAIKSGRAVIEVLPSSRVLANDGLGTNVPVEFGRGIYTVTPQPPQGVRVFSETHPFEQEWYNNNNPILAWEKEARVTDFSFILDNQPKTVPDNEPETEETTFAYEERGDGLWYFHIKARKDGVWGSSTHFLLRIDTSPPAGFTPEVEVLAATVVSRAFVTFFTTDALSGMSHYEVAVIDRTQSPLESPVFTQARSPYQLPQVISDNFRVIVRAVDKAGNVRDESLDVRVEAFLVSFIKEYQVIVLIGGILLILLLVAMHYLFKHHILERMRKIRKVLTKKESDNEKNDVS